MDEPSWPEMVEGGFVFENTWLTKKGVYIFYSL
jgi:hypothetical protein